MKAGVHVSNVCSQSPRVYVCACVCVSVWELVHFVGPYFHDTSMPNLYPKFPNPKSTPNHTPNSIFFFQ